MTETIDIPQTKTEREVLFRTLYQEAFPGVARYVAKQGGTLDEAKDVFQDALICYYERSLTEAESPRTSTEAYLFGIARHLWSKRYQQQKRDAALTADHWEQIAEELPKERAAQDRVIRMLEQAGKKCMKLLQAFYYHKRSMPELADDFGYRSTRSATVQKYKCLEKVRDQVHDKKLNYADFFE